MILEFHSKAKEEFIQTSQYYELQVSGLGEKFINEVEKITDLLIENPKLGMEFKKPFRRVILYRFPYSLIYSLEQSSIWIIAVAHQKLKPGYWQSRINL